MDVMQAAEKKKRTRTAWRALAQWHMTVQIKADSATISNQTQPHYQHSQSLQVQFEQCPIYYRGGRRFITDVCVGGGTHGGSFCSGPVTPLTSFWASSEQGTGLRFSSSLDSSWKTGHASNPNEGSWWRSDLVTVTCCNIPEHVWLNPEPETPDLPPEQLPLLNICKNPKVSGDIWSKLPEESGKNREI